MRRPLIITLTLVATIAALAATAAAATEPILSPRAYPYLRFGGLSHTKGFGQVKPRVIDYGGDPTGLVCRIHWHSWGGKVARGTGAGWYVGPHESVAQGHEAVAKLVASKRGPWKGRPAYNRLTWSFPNHGRDHTADCLP